MTLIAFLLSSFALAQDVPEKTDETNTIVKIYKDYEVYVAPVRYHINHEAHQANIPYHMIHNFASMHSRNAKVNVRYRTWESVELHGGMRVYNKDTIKYVWDNCKYNLDHRKCAAKNNHFFLETHVTVNEKEINISMTLFDANMQILGSSSISDKAITRWIRQQEITVIQEQSMAGSRTIVHKPKEELPLEWTIPPKLLSDAVRQASLRLWTGVRLD
ncbi:MAG: hypothetical protein GOVbin703_14 [Prokaryotic dsDNA virus sp.]|nr:MAG: hypothetical protein GOVbin703_14 [Prokaryotic dsDNA virus sp.]|tara:strand:+ start:364 stop:1014 length:651 start_codon:yes stop_codon:yes gene_type:complete